MPRKKLSKEIVNQRITDRGIVLEGDYLGARVKALFRCSENHRWMAPPSSVMRGNGCTQCSIRRFQLERSFTKEIVNQRLVDAGRTERLIGEYTNSQTKAEFACEYGHTWFAIPNNVLQGHGCPHCAGWTPLSKEIVNQRLIDAGRTERLTGNYVNHCTKTEFTCEDGHTWLATPNSVLGGRGCPHCAEYGFNPNKPATLYYLRIDSEHGPLWKVGITNRTVEARFKLNLRQITVIMTRQYLLGFLAREVEQEILSKYKHLRYKGPEVLCTGGNTELFVEDVLGLDKGGWQAV